MNLTRASAAAQALSIAAVASRLPSLTTTHSTGQVKGRASATNRSINTPSTSASLYIGSTNESSDGSGRGWSESIALGVTSTRNRRNDLDRVAVGKAPLARVVQQHLVVDGEVEHGI